jgi:hypothetical protein
MVHADFAMCLTRLVAVSRMKNEIAIINAKSSMVQRGRWSGVKQALSINADKILFIDSDQTFPADGLIRLLNHCLPIVGATCLTRRPPHEFTARGFDGRRMDFTKKQGLFEVASNGMPFCLIDAAVFKSLPEPWFNAEFDGIAWVSEDEYFCAEARKAGFKIWVDADLSKQVGHLGVKEFVCEPEYNSEGYAGQRAEGQPGKGPSA